MNRVLAICVCLITGFSLGLRVRAQSPQEKDTIHLRSGYVLYFLDQEILAKKDTIILLPKNTKYTESPANHNAGQRFFNTLEEKALGSHWSSQLHNIIIKSPAKNAITDTIQTQKTANVFIPYQSRIIRSICYKKLEPFGPSLSDTARQPSSQIEKLGNDMHVATQNKVIRNHMLFNEGDKLDPILVGDNERILRSLPFIHDALIQVSGDDFSDSADICILIKDAFPYGAGGEVNDVDAGKIELFHKNILGFGHQFHMIFHWDGEYSPWLGNEFIYRINNLSGTFINSNFRWAQVFDTETFEFGFDRKFFTPNTHYAGALNFQRISTRHNIALADTVLQKVPIKFDRTDLWIGRSFYLSSRSKYLQRRTNLVLAARFLNEFYDERPPISDSILYDYHHKNVLLFSLGISQQDFFKSNLIYSFGRTEDIPRGMLLNFTAGPEFSEFNTRWYAGIGLSGGGYLYNYGYLFGQLGYGGYIEKTDYLEQGLFNAKLNYFTNLFIINRYKVRHFLSLKYTRGVRRLDDELLNINDRNGIRGYKSDLNKGNHRVIMNYEFVAFTPYYLFGFRFAFFGFADFGVIGLDSEAIFDNQVHTGLGLGVRIKNERLVFETIQLRFGYYPTLADEKFPLIIDVSGEKRLNPASFYVTKPEVLKFN